MEEKDKKLTEEQVKFVSGGSVVYNLNDVQSGMRVRIISGDHHDQIAIVWGFTKDLFTGEPIRVNAGIEGTGEAISLFPGEFEIIS